MGNELVRTTQAKAMQEITPVRFIFVDHSNIWGGAALPDAVLDMLARDLLRSKKKWALGVPKDTTGPAESGA